MKYAVIGGQYRYYCYGFAKTLAGAKRMASANMEYWDNWQGWHYPSVYRAEDVYEVEDQFYGCSTHVPKYGAIPVAMRGEHDKTWTMIDMFFA